MLKKRIIFALLWDSGFFCQSRNFRLQRVGDYEWLRRQYRFDLVAQNIDELLLLDVSRGSRQSDSFRFTVSRLAESFQLPLSVGGGLDGLRSASAALAAGADKVIFNTAIFNGLDEIRETSATFGEQCVVASLDVRRTESGLYVYVQNGEKQAILLREFFLSRDFAGFGEVVLNSIDRDGTGTGLDLEMLDVVPPSFRQPVVLMGGVGKPEHIVAGLLHKRVDAVSTSNLLNFVGDGLRLSRSTCAQAGIALPKRASWISPTP